MSETNGQLIRITSKVFDAFVDARASRFVHLERSLSSIRSFADTVQRMSRRLQSATGREWFEAAGTLAFRLRYDLQDLQTEVACALRELDRVSGNTFSYRDVYEELRALQDEFGEVRYEAEDGCVVVTTEPVELDETYLGPFELHLELRSIATRSPAECLRVVALNPQPAATDENVTHPHVTSEQLCPGEAAEPMRAALVAGRLCDFFLLVRSVLNTYNPGSAYVRLERWDGRPCHECGYTVSEDESCWCEACEHEFCDECIGGCVSCCTSLCRGCLSSCGACSDGYCDSCLEPCAKCGESCCPDCLADGVCSDCRKDEEKNDDDQKTQHQPDQVKTCFVSAAREAPHPVRN